MINKDMNGYIDQVQQLQQSPAFMVNTGWHMALWVIGGMILTLGLFMVCAQSLDEEFKPHRRLLIGTIIIVLIGALMVGCAFINFHRDFIEHKAVTEKIKFLKGIIDNYKEHGYTGLPQGSVALVGK